MLPTHAVCLGFCIVTVRSANCGAAAAPWLKRTGARRVEDRQTGAPMMTGSQTAAVETVKMVAIMAHDHQSFSAGAATATAFPFLRVSARRTLGMAHLEYREDVA